MASCTLILLEKLAARPRGEGFFIAKGGGEKIRVAKKMIFRSKKTAYFLGCAGFAKNVIMGIFPKVPKSRDFEA